MFYRVLKKLSLTLAFTVLVGFCMVQIHHNGVYVNTSEFGLLELLQLLILGGSLLLGGVVLLRLYRTYHNRLDLIIGWMLWVVTFAIMGRETSWGSAYGLADHISDRIEIAAIILIGFVVISLAINWLFKEKEKQKFIIEALQLPIIPIFLTAAFFVLIGDFFEKKHFNFSYNQFLEEGYECVAYAIFLYGYYRFARKFFIK